MFLTHGVRKERRNRYFLDRHSARRNERKRERHVANERSFDTNLIRVALFRHAAVRSL